MPEFHPAEDQAALYVMGGLNPDERREFKVRLAESAELRVLVRDLEDGAVALAMTAPRRLPPQKVWRQIEKTVAQENRPAVLTHLFSGGWWRNGWAAAAACLVGWLLYAFWPTHPATTTLPPVAEIAPALPAPSRTTEPSPAKLADVEAARRSLRASIREMGDLRAQVGALESNDARLSQSVAQLQSLLGQSNRLQFVQFKPASTGDSPAPAVNLSPDLQRALALAMARELGWAQSPDASPGAESNSPGVPSVVTISNVDFVDLRPVTNGVSPANQSQSPTQPPVQAQPENQSAVVSAQPSSTPIPAFISGKDLILAIDSTIAPKDSQVSFSYQTPDQGQVSIGSVTVGSNPTVVTLPLNFGGYFVSSGGWSGPVAATGGSGPVTATIFSGSAVSFQTFTPVAPP